MIDLRRLEALVALHRTGSVSAAAAVLHYGQPTISHHLRRLEAETGAVLLQRVGRGIRLTPEGVLLARRGEEILGLLARAEAELRRRHQPAGRPGPPRGLPLRRGDPGSRRARTARHPPPGHRVRSSPRRSRPRRTSLLRAGTVDLALTFAYPDQPEPDQITSVPVLEDPLHLVVRTGADGPSPDDLGAFAGHEWITGCERCRRGLLALCADAGFTPAIAFASDDYVAVQSLVAAGLGVTVLPGLVLRAHRHPGVVAHRLAAHRRIQALDVRRATAPCRRGRGRRGARRGGPQASLTASISCRLASRCARRISASRIRRRSSSVSASSAGTGRAAPAPSIATKTKYAEPTCRRLRGRVPRLGLDPHADLHRGACRPS
ncbi:LysR substrate-binding domain-containing protein [Nocardioides convexus]|uniref:LysR family transcriptional regulator n=1 Tax=Nocardioides convexus TaxID=2712224 RepID=UPI0024184CBA|nr:LysR substrate-binding domain-containing protein [Nocardioides convexus]